MIHNSLDDPQVYESHDPQGMFDLIHQLPRQCQQAWQAALKFDLPPDYADVNKVVILGMGGSAIGGDLVRSLALTESKQSVFVQRDYDLPPFVDDRTLVVASSYSGETEETLSGFTESLNTPAKKLAMTTDGKLKSIAEAKEIPVFVIRFQSQPRAALGFSFLPLLCFFQKLGFVKDKSADVAEMVAVLEKEVTELEEKVPESRNPAKQLAQHLHGRVPVIYGAGITSEVARRWKTQINENTKAWAFYETLPEANHNAVNGYVLPRELAGVMSIVFLQSSHIHPRTQLRYGITAELLKQAGVSYQTVEGRGQSALSQMMSLVLFGDYVSCYLAMLYGIDPTPVKVISYLKEQLAKEK